MVKKPPAGFYAKAYACKTQEDNRALYKEWAATYDADMAGYDYVSTTNLAAVFARHVSKTDAEVLDAGCGTGLSGLALLDRGYSVIDGVDFSPEMLEKARTKNIYRRLIEGDILAGLAIEDDSYDAVISVGLFTLGHLPPDCLEELARVTRPGGVIVVTVSDKVYQQEGFPDKLRELEENGICAQLENFKGEGVIAAGVEVYYVVLGVGC